MENSQLELDLKDEEEAHYWQTLSNFCALVPKYGIDQMLVDMETIVRKEQ